LCGFLRFFWSLKHHYHASALDYPNRKSSIKKSQEEMKKYIDRNRREAVEYKVGNRMLLITKNLIW